MRSCRLRTALGQSEQRKSRSWSPAVLLGLACHNALDALVKDRRLFADSWVEETEAAWQQATREIMAEAGDESPPESVYGYQITRVRLRQVARRIRDIVGDPALGAVDLITEETLTSHDKKLFGRPDLIVRGGEHRIIDYKSGKVVNRESGLVKESYIRQLQLYAFLEWQTSGDWPGSAHLLPFSGAAVEVGVDPPACERLAAEAVRLLQDFNDAVPGDQPPAPSPQSCGYCAFPPHCHAFWSECDVSWQQDMLAVAGTVTSVFVTAAGDVTVRIRTVAGSCGDPEAVLWNVSVRDHPEIASAREGSFIAAVSLRADLDRSVFTLPEWGRFALSPPNAPRPF